MSRGNKTKLLVSAEPASCQGNYITAKVSTLTSYSKTDDILGITTLMDLILAPFVYTTVGVWFVTLYFFFRQIKKATNNQI